MALYNPRYDTKIQPFNISIIRKWITEKNFEELKKWLNEGEPNKRLLRDAISDATISECLACIKIFFEKDWISSESKISQVVNRINFCEKNDIWIFIRDIVFSDKKLIKKFSFPLFWTAKKKGKTHLFDEKQIDFSHDEASDILTYQYILNEKHEEKRDYLLSKGVLFIPYKLIDLINFQYSSYLIEMLRKHGDHPIFKTQEDVFVFACIVGVYYQILLNNVKMNNKSEEEKSKIISEQNFMLNLFKSQNIKKEIELTPKFLEKNKWINHNIEENYGDLCSTKQHSNLFGSLDLKYLKRNNLENDSLPAKQNVKLAWYWIGGKITEKRLNQRYKYVMTNEDKIYAEKEFEKFFN